MRRTLDISALKWAGSLSVPVKANEQYAASKAVTVAVETRLDP